MNSKHVCVLKNYIIMLLEKDVCLLHTQRKSLILHSECKIVTFMKNWNKNFSWRQFLKGCKNKTVLAFHTAMQKPVFQWKNMCYATKFIYEIIFWYIISSQFTISFIWIFLIKNFNRLKDKELDKNTINYYLDLL